MKTRSKATKCVLAFFINFYNKNNKNHKNACYNIDTNL